MTPKRGDRGDGPSRTAVVAQPGRIRFLGPVAVLALPGTLLVLATLAYAAYPCDGASCVRPTLASYFLVLLAVPTALLVGLPWFIHPLNVALAAGTSLMLWLFLGRWASRRATEDVDATWRTYAAELALVLVGIWGGIVAGLGVVGLWLSH